VGAIVDVRIPLTESISRSVMRRVSTPRYMLSGMLVLSGNECPHLRGCDLAVLSQEAEVPKGVGWMLESLLGQLGDAGYLVQP
jgi:hypothetical protein